MARQTEEILVKVGRTGGRVEEFSLEGDDVTVADALEAAKIVLTKGERLRVNGDEVDDDETLQDGDVITISGKIAGA